MSWLSKALHSSQGNSLFSFLVTIATGLVEANNPLYTPILTPVATALQNEIASMAAGNPPTPHAPGSVAADPTPAPAPVVAVAVAQ